MTVPINLGKATNEMAMPKSRILIVHFTFVDIENSCDIGFVQLRRSTITANNNVFKKLCECIR